MSEHKESDKAWETAREMLKGHGIDLESLCCGGTDTPRVKVVCLDSDVNQGVSEIGKQTRDQVVMVRVDEETSRALDAWVETGAVKSRSEAAAFFISEGLKVRATELDRLKGALNDLEKAKVRLRSQAEDILGKKPD